jgi:hypothetical protein
MNVTRAAQRAFTKTVPVTRRTSTNFSTLTDFFLALKFRIFYISDNFILTGLASKPQLEEYRTALRSTIEGFALKLRSQNEK